MIEIIQTAQAGVITDAPSVLELLMRGLRFILSIVSIITVLAVVIAGISYITSGGNSARVEQSKLILTGSIIGMVVSLLALVIVRAVISTL